jgi:hypothetical protein
MLVDDMAAQTRTPLWCSAARVKHFQVLLQDEPIRSFSACAQAFQVLQTAVLRLSISMP